MVNLERLHRLVLKAQAEVDRQLDPGEVRRFEFFTSRLSDEGWRLGWQLVADLRAHHPDLFNFYSEEALHMASLDFVVGEAEPPSFELIAQHLLAEVAEPDRVLVAIPLANIALDRAWAPAGQTAALVKAYGADPSHDMGAAADESIAIRFGLFHHLGDHLRPAARKLHFATDHEIDTGRTATLFSIEAGPAQVAVEIARAKAHYALATWALLAPPPRFHLLPDVADWAPQPYLHQGARHKLLEASRWIGTERDSTPSIRRWSPYPAPADEILAAPFEAFAAIRSRPAQALLSATSARLSACRAPRSMLSERIRDVRAALESLCEPPDCASVSAGARWIRLSDRFRVWDQVASTRAYSAQALAEVQSRLLNARNVSTHGADAALLDLGWPAGDRRLRGRAGTAPRSDFAQAALRRDLGVMTHAVSEALRATWREMRLTEFDQDAFERLFELGS